MKMSLKLYSLNFLQYSGTKRQVILFELFLHEESNNTLKTEAV